MTKWLHAFRQTTTYLGVAVIAIIWGGIYLLTCQAHERAYQDAVRQGNNLTRVLEEYIRRVVQASDSELLALRRAYQSDPQHFDIAGWVVDTRSNSDLSVEFGIVGADGFIMQSKQGTADQSGLRRRSRAFQISSRAPRRTSFISARR